MRGRNHGRPGRPPREELDRLSPPADTRRAVPSKWSNTGAKRAREARAELGFTRAGPLPDVLAATERAGAHVVLLDLPEGLAGAYIAKPGCPLLFVNGNQAVARQRFTLAHEFGHFRMRHRSVVDGQVAISGYLHDPDEVCANAFAAEFLMPRDAIAAWASDHVRGAVTLEHVVLLACEYGVSAQAARYALETTGVLTGHNRKEQLDDEIGGELHIALFSQLGLQPVEDELAAASAHRPRIPRSLRDSPLGDLLAGQIDVDGFAVRLSCEPARAAAMLSAFGLDRLLPA
jgi:Zn-dependent peptidase ImmA (M78 family)